MDEAKRAAEIIRLLKKNYPDAKYYLDFSSPLELMVAAILSAQVRDEAVNALTPALFRKYRTAKDYAWADLKELTSYVKSVTFAGNKARHIKEACGILVEKYDGKVPKTMEELTSLPGIGNKTAATILLNAYGIATIIPVDTHVIRLSYRLGWTKSKDPDKIERDLGGVVPKDEWEKIAYMLKAHGRAICKAPVPECSKCFLFDLCPRTGVIKYN